MGQPSHVRAHQASIRLAAKWVKEHHPDLWADMLTATREHYGLPPAAHGPRPIVHGTLGGSRAHYRRGEKPCDACLTAASQYQRRHREQVAS